MSTSLENGSSARQASSRPSIRVAIGQGRGHTLEKTKGLHRCKPLSVWLRGQDLNL
jgi:hypothetical protein